MIYEIHSDLDESLKKLSKKDKVLFEHIMKNTMIKYIWLKINIHFHSIIFPASISIGSAFLKK